MIMSKQPTCKFCRANPATNPTIMLTRINELGEKGEWCCHVCLPKTTPSYVQEIVGLRKMLAEANARNMELEAQGAEMRQFILKMQHLHSFCSKDQTCPCAYHQTIAFLTSTTLGAKLVEEVENLRTIVGKCNSDWGRLRDFIKGCNGPKEMFRFQEAAEKPGGKGVGMFLNYITNIWKEIDDTKSELTTTQQKLAAAITLIKCKEWKAFLGYYECAYCGNCENKIHRADCAIVAVLKDADASGWVHVDGELVKALESAINANHPRASFPFDPSCKLCQALKMLSAARSTSTQGTK